ncbi:MAG: sugar ABC transporter permease [Spirochaetales bacterium]|nr:sugar ABC transporter permease [Spirochaetales bacterium]
MTTFYLSFFKWNLIRHLKPFIGLYNFVKLLGDENFKTAIWNTTLFAAVVVVLTLFFSLLLALLLKKKIFGGSFFETIFFLPIIIPLVPISLTWKWIYDPTNGVLNYVIGLFGIPKQGWLINPQLALGSIMIMTIWQRIGYNMIIFLVGLREIPTQYYEAAKVDGAGKWQAFIFITLPLLVPITLYLTVMNTIEAFRIFTPVYVMTTGAQGAPASAVRVLVMDIYQNAFRYFNLGYASAESLVLFLIILFISLLQFGIFRRRGILE